VGTDILGIYLILDSKCSTCLYVDFGCIILFCPLCLLCLDLIYLQKMQWFSRIQVDKKEAISVTLLLFNKMAGKLLVVKV